MDFRPGVDVALPSDVGGRVVGMAESRMAESASVLFHPTHAQRCVDTDLFWSASARLGASGNSPPVACHHRDNESIFPDQQMLKNQFLIFCRTAGQFLLAVSEY